MWLKEVLNYIDILGLVPAELKCDREPSTMEHARVLASRCKAKVLTESATPRGWKGSAGRGDRANLAQQEQLRALRAQLIKNEIDVGADHRLMGWMVRGWRSQQVQTQWNDRERHGRWLMRTISVDTAGMEGRVWRALRTLCLEKVWHGPSTAATAAAENTCGHAQPPRQPLVIWTVPCLYMREMGFDTTFDGGESALSQTNRTIPRRAAAVYPAH